jgi:hypothetical protein
MASQYATYQPAIQPTFEQMTWGQRWGASFGSVKDTIIQETILGVMARFPNFAPLDALGLIGLERGITQGPNESVASFIARLVNAWGEWTIGGTYWGLLAQLNGAGYTTAYIAATNGFVYGPSAGVTAPDPINGIAGNPPTWVQLGPYYASGGTQTVFPPWTFGAGNGQGQNDTASFNPVETRSDNGGSPDPTGAFWSRFVVLIDPYPGTWTDVVNPPTSSTAPSNAEIDIISQIINTWKPGKSTCVGILAMNGGTRACFAWPQTVTTHIPFSCWLSRAIITGDSPSTSAFVATKPESIYSWLPNTPVANAGGSTYIFTVPSSHYQTAHTGTQYLYSSPASSGTTGLVEPSWPTSLGGTVTDNGITWTCIATLTNFSGGSGATCFQITGD